MGRHTCKWSLTIWRIIIDLLHKMLIRLHGYNGLRSVHAVDILGRHGCYFIRNIGVLNVLSIAWMIYNIFHWSINLELSFVFYIWNMVLIYFCNSMLRDCFYLIGNLLYHIIIEEEIINLSLYNII